MQKNRTALDQHVGQSCREYTTNPRVLQGQQTDGLAVLLSSMMSTISLLM